MAGGFPACLTDCWLCLTAGRGWTHGGPCLYEPTPATVCRGDEVDARGLRLQTWRGRSPLLPCEEKPHIVPPWPDPIHAGERRCG